MLRALGVLAVVALLFAPAAGANHLTQAWIPTGVRVLDEGPVVVSWRLFSPEPGLFCPGPTRLQLTQGTAVEEVEVRVDITAQVRYSSYGLIHLEGCFPWGHIGVVVLSLTNEDLDIYLSGWYSSAHAAPNLVLQGGYRGDATVLLGIGT